jgi:C-terminal processing protease CtpA/Prc
VLSWGGALKFTVAHYMSPLGTPIDGKGVTPNIEIAYDHGDIELGLSDNLAGPNYVYSVGKDAQLDAALGEAQSKIRSGG